MGVDLFVMFAVILALFNLGVVNRKFEKARSFEESWRRIGLSLIMAILLALSLWGSVATIYFICAAFKAAHLF